MAEGQKTPWRLKAEKMVADLQPHSYDEILAEVGDLIPAGQAFRKSEISRLHALRRKQREGQPTMHEDLSRVKGDRETAIRSGRRIMLIQMLHSMQKAGIIRTWKEDKQTWCQKVMDDSDRVQLIREALADKSLRDWELLSKIVSIIDN